MIDLNEDVLAPTVIERALSIFGSFRDLARSGAGSQSLPPHVFDLISHGQIDEKQLMASAVMYLKLLEARIDET
jgi:hypothetical protein